MTHYFTESNEGIEYPEVVECVAKTPGGALKLVLVSDKDAFERTCFFVPVSVIHDDSEVYDIGHVGTLTVENWYGNREGW